MGKVYVNKKIPGGNKKNFGNKKRKKVNLEFDEKERHDFLTGFQKRRNERRVRAKEEEKDILKMEKKRIQKQKKERLQSHLKMCEDALAAIASAEDAVAVMDEEITATNSHVVELPNHTVTVTELDTLPSSIDQKIQSPPEKNSSDDSKKNKISKTDSSAKQNASKLSVLKKYRRVKKKR